MSDLERLTDSLGTLEGELVNLKKAALLIGDAKDAAQRTIESAEAVGMRAQEMTKRMSDVASHCMEVLNAIHKVDFPSRLEKLDTTVGAVQTGIHNVLGRTNSVEQNLRDVVVSEQSQSRADLDKGVKALQSQAKEFHENALVAMQETQTVLKKRFWLLTFLVAGSVLLSALLLLLRLV